MTLNATLVDDMGNPITGGNISFYVNGTFIGNATVIEGQASINYTPTMLGNLTVNGTYSSNGAYFINILPGQLQVVEKFETNSTIVAPNTKVGKTTNITGVVTDEFGNPIANTAITVTVDGISYTVTTDNNGRWTLVYTPAHAGNVTVTVTWAGDDEFFGFTNSTTFNVGKLVTNSTIVIPENVKVGKTITISGVVSDEFGNPIANTLINVTVNGQTYTIATDSAGRWVLAYTPTHAGNVNVTVSWEGNNMYRGFTNSTTFNVEEPPTPTPENETNETTNISAAEAAMKETGIPINMILLVLLSVLGVLIGRKQ